MSDLKPCPFCGGKASRMLNGNEDNYFWWVECSDCNATIDSFATSTAAIEAWNTRADDNEEVTTCFNCGAQIDMLGMFTPLAKSSVLYRHYATYCPACGERLVD